MASTSEPFIRPVDYATDRPALDHIFRITCGDNLKYEPAWTISSYLWCHPYPILCPKTCFLLDDGTGQAVGYTLGTPDTIDFAARWPSQFLPPVLESLSQDQLQAKDATTASLLPQIYHPDQAEAFSLPGMVEKWPAHLHIDILPSHQAKGWGARMIGTLLEALKGAGATGVHLGMDPQNAGALKFYLRLGFEKYWDAVDGDPSQQKSGGALYLVKKL